MSLPILFRPLAKVELELDEAIDWYRKRKPRLGTELKEAVDQMLVRNAIKKLFGKLVLVAGVVTMSMAAESAAASGIEVYSGNPFYWQYAGKPVLLLGGSSAPRDLLNDEGMFLWPNVTEALDKLAGAGGNYTRCLMSGRLRGEPLWPFVRSRDRYDLDRWNDEYWRLFETFLKETQARGITTDIELWATFDYARLPWTRNPFNPTNNLNYTAAQTGLSTAVDSHPVQARNEFFHTLPGEKNIPEVLKYQQRFVDKVLSYTLQYDNVIYCMDNETGASPEWGAYWARYVRATATKASKKVCVTEMFDSHDLSNPVYGNILDHPDVYDFIEIAQNNHQTGQTHYDRVRGAWQRIATAPRPLNNVKIYGADGGNFGTTKEAMERFWRNIFGGCASARFHEKHLGDSAPALRMIRSAREVTAAFDLFHSAPHNDLLWDREPNEAYCLATPGKEYAVYFPVGGHVQLDVSELKSDGVVRWYDIDTGRWADSKPVRSEKTIVLTAPGPGQWAAVVGRVDPEHQGYHR